MKDQIILKIRKKIEALKDDFNKSGSAKERRTIAIKIETLDALFRFFKAFGAENAVTHDDVLDIVERSILAKSEYDLVRIASVISDRAFRMAYAELPVAFSSKGLFIPIRESEILAVRRDIGKRVDAMMRRYTALRVFYPDLLEQPDLVFARMSEDIKDWKAYPSMNEDQGDKQNER